MASKRYKLEFNWWVATILIDEEKAAPVIKEMVEFWAGWERRLRHNKGNYTKSFLDDFAAPLIEASIDNDLDSIRKEYFKNREGYCIVLDGSEGILLETCDQWVFEREDFSIQEVVQNTN